MNIGNREWGIGNGDSCLRVLRVTFFLFFFFTFSLLIFSCSSHLDLPSTEKLPEGYGSLSLSLDTGRTILPDTPGLSSFAVYELDFKVAANSSGEAQKTDRTNETLASEPVIIKMGTYNLTVKAFWDKEKTKLAAQGTRDNIVISGGGNTSHNVTLYIENSGGAGTFDWKVNITATGVTRAEMAIKNGTAINGSPFALALSSETAGVLPLDSGVYEITFTLKKEEGGILKEEAVWNELLYIYGGLTSSFSIKFDDDFFYSTCYTVTLHNADGTQPGSQSVTHGGMFTPATLSRDNFIFIGWYTDIGLTLPYVSSPVYKSFSLYAKWLPSNGDGTEDAPFIVANANDLNAAKTAINGKTGSFFIFVFGDVGVEGGSTSTFGTTASGSLSVKLTGSGKLYLTSPGRLFYLRNNQTVILDSDDLTLEGLSNNNAAVVHINSGAFTMNGGTITGNTNTETGSAGGVYVQNGTFTMYGGEVSGNTVTNGGGGGVYVAGDSSYFVMEGGTISDNGAIGGSGVGVSLGHFTMNGGKISNNITTSSSSTNGNGGGVSMAGGTGTFTMTGGEISGNTAARNGGGVYLDNSTFTMTGGVISGNTAINGGGVYVNSSTYAIFRLMTGTVYGNEYGTSADEQALRNIATAASNPGAALFKGTNGTAQRGTLSGTTWNNLGDLTTGNTTIKVENGLPLP